GACAMCAVCYGLLSSQGAVAPDACQVSLHDALPICSSSYRKESPRRSRGREPSRHLLIAFCQRSPRREAPPSPLSGSVRVRICSDRKSTRLNSSHVKSSYAVFCLSKEIHDNARVEAV